MTNPNESQLEENIPLTNANQSNQNEPERISESQEKDRRKFLGKLNKAIVNKETEQCREILREGRHGGHNINYRSDSEPFFHPFLLAAKNDCYEILKLLIDFGADINTRDQNKCNALHYAIEQRCEKCCDLLLESRIDVEIKDEHGNLPLHMAVKENMDPVVINLLQLHPDGVNCENNLHQTPVHIAADKGYANILKHLLENGGKWDYADSKNKKLAIHFAAYSGHVECCEILIEASGNTKIDHINQRNKFRETPLILAASKGYWKTCRILKESDVDAVDIHGDTALHLAASEGHLTTVTELLKLKPTLKNNKKGNSPIHDLLLKFLSLSQEKKIEVEDLFLASIKDLVQYFDRKNKKVIDKSFKTEKEDKTIVHLAVECNLVEGLEFLLEGPSFVGDLNSIDADGNTPLHCALIKGRTKSVEYLLKRKEINFFAFNDEKNIPLHEAAKMDLVKACEFLSNLKSDSDLKAVEYRNEKGQTPLHLAAMNGSVECCRQLMKLSNSISEKDKDDYTPCHLAAKAGHLDILKLFTKEKKGFVSQIAKIDGETTLHLAAREGHVECCEFLLNKIAKGHITKENRKMFTPLDVAFFDDQEIIAKKNGDTRRAQKDEIFSLILEKIEFPKERVRKEKKKQKSEVGSNEEDNERKNGTKELRSNEEENERKNDKKEVRIKIDEDEIPEHMKNQYHKLHYSLNKYMHIAIKENRTVVQEAIVKSDWWYSAFSSSFCDSGQEDKATQQERLNQNNVQQQNTDPNTAQQQNTDPNTAQQQNTDPNTAQQQNTDPNTAQQQVSDIPNVQQTSLVTSALVPLIRSRIWSNLSAWSTWSTWSTFVQLQLKSSNPKDVQHQCSNLNSLSEKNQELAEVVFNKCIEKTSAGSTSEKYQFQLFEDSFYVPRESKLQRYYKRESPFCEKSGKLKKDSMAYSKPNPHPLEHAVDKGLYNLLKHPLTEAYLSYKCNAYIAMLLYILFAFEIAVSIILGIFLSEVRYWNLNITTNEWNLTADDICSNISLSKSQEEVIWSSMMSITILWILLFICIAVFIIIEVNFLLKVKYSIYSIEFVLRFSRFAFISLSIIPFRGCAAYHGINIKETWQWQIGVLALLVTWFHIIHIANEIPALNVFMPVTIHFMSAFLKTLMYILSIIFIFAFIFHLLVDENDAFVNIPTAFIKTIVWVLGDLGYDDTFLESELTYPVMTNFMFIFLVTSVTGFIANLFIVQPSNSLDYFRERSAYHKLASKIQMVLKLDSLSRTLNKWYVKAFYVKDLENESCFSKCKCFFKRCVQKFEYNYNYVKDQEETEEKGIDKLQLILDKLEAVETRFEKLEKLCDELQIKGKANLQNKEIASRRNIACQVNMS